MSHPRRTLALLVPALLLLLPPGSAHAQPASTEVSAPAGAPSLAVTLTAAWDWLLSLAAPPQEDLDGLNTVIKLPGCFEGSHLDPNGEL